MSVKENVYYFFNMSAHCYNWSSTDPIKNVITDYYLTVHFIVDFIGKISDVRRIFIKPHFLIKRHTKVHGVLNFPVSGGAWGRVGAA